MSASRKIPEVCCPYCAERAELVNAAEVQHRGEMNKVWLCRPCRAWVGTHRDSKRFAPLGRLAKAPLRAKKVEATFWFDRVWRSAMVLKGWPKKKAMETAYGWLAKEMGLPVNGFHLGFLDEAQTERVIRTCSSLGNRKDVAA